MQDVLLWSMVTDLPLSQQAPAVVLQQTGTVREILRALDVNVLANGGIVDMLGGAGPMMQSALTIVLYVLSQKFLPLGYEQNVLAAQNYLGFQRMSGETIDAALCRYDTVRYKAQEEANLNLGPTGTAYHLLKALHIPPAVLNIAAAAVLGNMPTTEQQLIAMEGHFRRQGHLLEGVLQQQTQQTHFYNWTPGGAAPPTPAAAAPGFGFFPGFAGTTEQSYPVAPMQPMSGESELVPGTECEHCGMYVYDEDDDWG